MPKRRTEAFPFRIEGVQCRLITLTRNQFAIVDAADYDWLTQWNWCAIWNGPTKSFYARRNSGDEKNSSLLMHRFILGLKKGDHPIGDHISGITLDNRRHNLRLVDKYRSRQNRGVFSNNSSGFTGIYKNHAHWEAEIGANGENYWLGRFSSLEEAVAARQVASEKHFGKYARK